MAKKNEEKEPTLPPIELLYPNIIQLTLDRAKLEEVANRAIAYVIQNMFPSSMSERSEGVKLIKGFIEPILEARIMSSSVLTDIDKGIDAAINRLGGDLQVYVDKRVKEILDAEIKTQVEERKSTKGSGKAPKTRAKRAPKPKARAIPDDADESED